MLQSEGGCGKRKCGYLSQFAIARVMRRWLKLGATQLKVSGVTEWKDGRI
jgi:hypothetical protein